MAYLLNDEELIEALHALRWHEELPTEVNGLNPNILIETAIDRIRAGMRITVDIPSPIKLTAPHEKIKLIVGPGQDWVEIDGNGDITIFSNGGPGKYRLNVGELIQVMRDVVKPE